VTAFNPPSLSTSNRNPRLLLIVAVAVAVRVAMIAAFKFQLDNDPDMYAGLAIHVAQGHGYLRPDTVGQTAYRPPIYPLLLATVIEAKHSVWWIAWIHLLLGTGSVVLTWFAAERLLSGTARDIRDDEGFDGERPPRTVNAPFVAAGWVAVDPLLLQNTVLVMTETLATLLAVLVLWMTADDSRKHAAAVAIGVIFGLCCLCRPTFWAFGGLVGVVWFARQFLTRPNTVPLDSRLSTLDPQPTLDPRSSILHPRRLALCAVLGTAVTVAPWAIRNWMVFGRPIITTTHGGYTLLLVHNPVYYREVVEQAWGTAWPSESLTAWQASLETALRADGVPPFDEVARDRWMYRQAWRNIADDPGLAVRAGWTLLGRFWGVMPLNTPERSLPTALRWGIGLFYVAEFLAMGLGLWRLTRAEWPRWWPLVALIVSFTCVHYLYWADMRMRAPLVPAIALLAARGLTSKSQGPSKEART
jgi:hypothetical protein